MIFKQITRYNTVILLGAYEPAHGEPYSYFFVDELYLENKKSA